MDREIASGSYADADALIHDLLRERASGLATLLEDGLASGESALTAEQVFAEARAKFHSRQS